MGAFTRWMARHGAVGGTARWALNGYRFFRSRHPDPTETTDRELFRLMIVHRYEALPNPRNQGDLLGRCDEVNGLMGLVIEVLKVEAGLAENATGPMIDFAEVIWNELERSGLPRGVLFGAATGLSDYSQVMFERPAS